ncbi:hypothetical protein F5J12DRAFT_292925 [Pisolithus orientalis]|uniref:uncharacterized protein n=1 Tax=Pisolithus orientalis TaxID=936130 RepID=UPI002223F577|nr:uncharacterized protein F5J12DRAFT_292925 [Pisolithus orientalis]KAI6030457.1 hypothetical protein F5J12DRAFT_292925 [Pisolithus orientalis]
MSVSSGTSSPAPTTPVSSLISLASTATKALVPPKQKPVNIFSNDGSFLERFQRSKRVVRIIRRGETESRTGTRKEKGNLPIDLKTGASVISLPLMLLTLVTTTDEQENPAKKPKRGGTPPLTNYQKEVH